MKPKKVKYPRKFFNRAMQRAYEMGRRDEWKEGVKNATKIMNKLGI